MLARKRVRTDYAGMLYILPALLVVAVLVVYPTIDIVRLSFVRTSGPMSNLTARFVGFGNYVDVVTGRFFATVLRNTVVWTIGSVALQYLLGLLAALILNQPFRGRTVVRTVMMLPWAVPGIVAALTWRWMYDADFGLVNAVLRQSGLAGLQTTWLSQQSTALPAIIVANVWMIYPFAALMLLAGLQSIPPELGDAASIDGAGTWQRFWHVTHPLLRPISIVVVLLMTIWALNGFVLIYAMTGGGPGFQTEILGLTIYRLGFKEFRFDMAAACAVILLIFMVAFAAAYIRFVEREDR